VRSAKRFQKRIVLNQGGPGKRKLVVEIEIFYRLEVFQRIRIYRMDDRTHRVSELLGRQSAPVHSLESVIGGDQIVLVFRFHRRKLVGTRCCDSKDQILQVVAIPNEIGGQPVQQILTPRNVVHQVHGFDDAASHELCPHAVDNCTVQASVLRGGEELSELFQSVFNRSCAVDVTKLFEDDLCTCELPCGLVTSVDLQR